MPITQAPPATQRRYSKSSAFYRNTKQDFYATNEALLAESLTQNQWYTSQPARTRCKLCTAPIADSASFVQHGVGYIFCTMCDHLNGLHEDTEAFVQKLYVDDADDAYARDYLDPQFAQRCNDIYLPKVDFLREALSEGVSTLLDVGCGSGYLVASARQRNIAATGIDLSAAMVAFGNAQMTAMPECHVLPHDSAPLSVVHEDSFFEAIRTTNAQVVSAIGVIEHLRQPQRFFEAFGQSNAEYVFYSVPLFSPAVLIEHLFPGVFPRQLSGGHTHLFTERSLTEMHRQLGVTPIAEWRFGTDVQDVYRSAAVLMSKSAPELANRLDAQVSPMLDELQAVLDRHHACSEIHVVARKSC